MPKKNLSPDRIAFTGESDPINITGESDPITIRFYAALNDFLSTDKRQRPCHINCSGRQTVKDIIESLGVPHAEVDLILVNGQSVGFTYLVQQGDLISVYPEFESLDISPLIRLRPPPLRQLRFILDVHLGKLAGLLRILGFDTLYRNDYHDEEIASIARREKRVILTRDVGLLKRNLVERGYFVRSTRATEQCREIITKFDLSKDIKPFERCMRCNGLIRKTDKKDIESSLLPGTRSYFEQFCQCRDCRKIYWQGSHYRRLSAFIKDMQTHSKK